MNRKEPYIGMPIILGEYDEITAAKDCNVEIRPQPPQQPDVDCKPDIKPQPPMPPECEPDIKPQPPQPEQPPECEPQQRMALAMAYVPWQRWQQPYDYEKGLMVGTIFPDLDLPFLGYQGGMKR